MKRSFAMLLILVLLLTGCASSPMGSPMGSPIGEGSYGPGKGMPEGSAHPSEQIIPGTLTAGEWNDGENLAFWYKLLNQNDWYAMMENRTLYPDHLISVFAHDEAGNPCYNVPVQLLDSELTVLYEGRTDLHGKAILPADLLHEGTQPVWVSAGGEQHAIIDDHADVTVTGSAIAEQLDLMLMVDTTGSMSDELRYLQKELEDVVDRVAEAGKTLSIRVSVNFYRDEGDEYVIRDFPFTEDIAQAIQQLNNQNTDGGGDTPEAVHKALDNMVYDHQWRNDAVKLCFFVLDAPPHSNREIQGIDSAMRKTVSDAASKGIRIIPVASSGVDQEAEFLLRSWALMTGGTYTFLTDHSGVGNAHLEPTIGDYEVEKLNECLIRIICQYCGLEYTKPQR